MGGPVKGREIVLEFWRRMASNDFALTSAVLADDFVLEWPQSKERIRGAGNFARMNTEYPANGPWTFEINRLVSEDSRAEASQAQVSHAEVTHVVTDVSITDGVRVARAISFFTLTDRRISRLVEYWPEPFEAPANRSHLVEPME